MSDATSKTCSIDDCTKTAASRGWCRTHYARWQRHGDANATVRRWARQGDQCAAVDCANPPVTRGYCHGHYERLRKDGDVGVAPLAGSRTICSVEGCEKPYKSKGFCDGHYQRARQNNGDPGPAQLQEKVARPDECVVDGCTDKVRARLMCGRHYQVAKEGGELKSKRPQAPAGSGWITAEGYHYFKKDGVTYAKHRVVMEQHLGRALFPWETVDHLTEGPIGRSNNRIENLRLMVGKHPRGHDPENVVSYGRQMLALYGSPEERERYASLLSEITNDSDVTVALESARAYAKAKAGERPATPAEETA